MAEANTVQAIPEKKKDKTCLILILIAVLLFCCCSSSLLIGFISLRNSNDFDYDQIEEYIPDEFDDLVEDSLNNTMDDNSPETDEIADYEALPDVDEVRSAYFDAFGYKFEGTIEYPEEDGTVTISGTFLNDDESYFTSDEKYGDVDEVYFDGIYYINYGDAWEITEEPYNSGIQRSMMVYFFDNFPRDIDGYIDDNNYIYAFNDVENDEYWDLSVDPTTLLPRSLYYSYYSEDYDDYIYEIINFSNFDDITLNVEKPEI